MNRIRVLCIDNHPCTRRGIALFLNSHSDLELVGTAATGKQGLEMCKTVEPDVILIEPRLSGEDGMAVIRALRAASPHTAIVVFSGLSDEEKLREVVQAGATGYLTKDISADELAQSVRDVRCGQIAMSSHARHALLRAVCNSLEQEVANTGTTGTASLSLFSPGAGVTGFTGVTAETAPVVLSMREEQVARLVSEGLANKQIAEQLLLSPATVKVHVKNIMAKLGVKARIQVVHRAQQQFYSSQAWASSP